MSTVFTDTVIPYLRGVWSGSGLFVRTLKIKIKLWLTTQNSKNEPLHENSNNVVCLTSKGSDQPAHMRSLTRAYAGRF